MVSDQALSILKSAPSKVSSVRLTLAEEQKIERFAEELRIILEAARLRAF